MAKTIFMICHSDGTIGGLGMLKEYFKAKGYTQYLLLHPLDDYSKHDTLFVQPNKKIIVKRKPLGSLSYLQDLWYSSKFIYQTNFDVFLGLSNFDTLPAIIARKILRKEINKIIYYPRDYSGKRFANSLLNKAYIYIEKTCVKHADLVISNTKRSEAKRIELGLQKSKSLFIPNPVFIKEVKFKPKNISANNFIYVGDVSAEHGLYDLINNLDIYVENLTIIGSGKDLDRTIQLIKSKGIKLKLYRNKTHKFTINHLKNFNGFGLAPYNDSSEWTYYCSPLKVGEYIACGIPVVMSSRPEISEQVTKKKYGVVFKDKNSAHIKQLISEFNCTDFYIKSENFYHTNNPDVLFKSLNI